MSLLEITKLPTAENSAIHLHESDNIAVARVPLSPGQQLRVDGISVVVREPVPAGHKVALSPIVPGDTIVRYGQVMGRARIVIQPGDHVHVHNVGFEELAFAYEFPAAETEFRAPARDMPTFFG